MTSTAGRHCRAKTMPPIASWTLVSCSFSTSLRFPKWLWNHLTVIRRAANRIWSRHTTEWTRCSVNAHYTSRPVLKLVAFLVRLKWMTLDFCGCFNMSQNGIDVTYQFPDQDFVRWSVGCFRLFLVDQNKTVFSVECLIWLGLFLIGNFCRFSIVNNPSFLKKILPIVFLSICAFWANLEGSMFWCRCVRQNVLAGNRVPDSHPKNQALSALTIIPLWNLGWTKLHWAYVWSKPRQAEYNEEFESAASADLLPEYPKRAGISKK